MRTLKTLAVLCLVATAPLSVEAAIRKQVEVTVTPPGASLAVDGVAVSRANPTASLALRWENKKGEVDRRVIRIELAEHETQVVEITNTEADVKEKVLKYAVELAPLSARATVQFETTPRDAQIALSTGQTARSLDNVELVFKRGTSQEPWQRHVATITAPDHGAVVVELDYASVKANPRKAVELKLLRREIPVSITSNERDARVLVDKQEIGSAPIVHKFLFTRGANSEEWDSHLVVVDKTGFRAKPKEGSNPNPTETGAFSTTLRLADAEKGELHAELEPIKYLPVPVYQLAFEGRKPDFLVEMRIADVSPSAELFPALKRSEFDSGEVIDTRIWVSTNSEDVIYSSPRNVKFDALRAAPADATPRAQPTADLIMNIRGLVGQAKKQITDGRYIDIDPCLSPDDAKVYFASNRGANNRFVICAIESNGTGGIVRVTDSPSSVFDLEPAMSPDGRRLAFTRLEEGKTTKYLWICDFERGREFIEICPGENPSWSPNGKLLAFIDTDGGRKKLKVKDPTGGPPTTLTSGDHNQSQPCWTPDGKRIVYCSDESIDPITGIRNWDIYIINADGSEKRQLTNSISHDQRPVVSANGRYVYFLSNRGARTVQAPFLQIWRLELPAL